MMDRFLFASYLLRVRYSSSFVFCRQDLRGKPHTAIEARKQKEFLFLLPGNSDVANFQPIECSSDVSQVTSSWDLDLWFTSGTGYQKGFRLITFMRHNRATSIIDGLLIERCQSPHHKRRRGKKKRQ